MTCFRPETPVFRCGPKIPPPDTTLPGHMGPVLGAGEEAELRTKPSATLAATDCGCYRRPIARSIWGVPAKCPGRTASIHQLHDAQAKAIM